MKMVNHYLILHLFLHLFHLGWMLLHRNTKKVNDITYFLLFVWFVTVVNFILRERLSCTLGFPDFKPVEPWFPVVLAHASQVVPIGFKGDTGVLLYPSKKGFFLIRKACNGICLLQVFALIEFIKNLKMICYLIKILFQF